MWIESIFWSRVFAYQISIYRSARHIREYSHVTYVNESRRTYKWVMSHMWIHLIFELYHIYETATHCNMTLFTCVTCHAFESISFRAPSYIRHCNTLQHTAIHCNMTLFTYGTCKKQHTATHCNTLQHTATWLYSHMWHVTHVNPSHLRASYHRRAPFTVNSALIVLDFFEGLQHAATRCNTLQHSYGVLGFNRPRIFWRTATCCNTLQLTYGQLDFFIVLKFFGGLQHTATRCNTLQHAATRCNTLQHTYGQIDFYYPQVFWRTATRCNKLQHAATRCNTLQHTYGQLDFYRPQVFCARFRAPPASWSTVNTYKHIQQMLNIHECIQKMSTHTKNVDSAPEGFKGIRMCDMFLEYCQHIPTSHVTHVNESHHACEHVKAHM